MTSKSVLCCTLLALAVASDVKVETPFNKAPKTFMADNTDVASVAEITRNGSAIEVHGCGSADDAFKLDTVMFDPKTWTLNAFGALQRQLSGGNVTANISLGKPPRGATIGETMKRFVAFSLVKKTHHEPLCQNLARGLERQYLPTPACPFAPGPNMLHFSLGRLPRTVVAGVIKFEIRAVDGDGLAVACLKGSIDVPRGANGQLFRKLQDQVVTSTATSQTALGVLPFFLIGLEHI